MSQADISVVIPAYNAKDKIKPTLESIFSQTLKPKEVIIVDDGSSDGTFEFLQNLPYELTLHQQANAGPSAARNKGVSLASSHWIAFCDADDLWLPNKLEQQVAAHQLSEDVDISFTNLSYRKNDVDGGTASEAADKSGLASMLELLGNEVLFPSTMMVRKSAFDRVSGFDSRYKWAEDIDFILRILANSKGFFLGEVLAIHQVFQDSLSRSVDSEKGNLCLIRAWESYLASAHCSEPSIIKLVNDKLAEYYFDMAYHNAFSRRTGYFYKSWSYNRKAVTPLAHFLVSVFVDRFKDNPELEFSLESD
jgi:glycosyltransferase involved in cell wall biosynthesis